MSFRSTTIRRIAAACLAVTLSLTLTPTANGCWLTNWLYGRPASPYAAGYAPYTAGYAPYTAGYAPYTAGYAPLAQTSYSLPITTPLTGPAGYGLQQPAYSMQRPALLDNASVYTGRPVLGSAYPPSALPLRGATTTSNPFYGTGNQYPTNYQVPATSAPLTSYRPTLNSGAAGVIPVTPNALPTTTTVPLYAAPVQRPAGGLARFFGSLLGTNYRSSYYAAPVTYYRPATSVDPITGTTVTTQQACSSYVQQLQRTPYTGFDLAPSTVSTTPIAPADCGTSTYAPQGYGGVATDYLSPPSGIGQVGGLDDGSSQVIPIPATPNTAPLRGAPNGYSDSRGSNDLTPMGRPELNGQRSLRPPTTNDDDMFGDGIPADGQWRLKSSTDPEASRMLDSTSQRSAASSDDMVSRQRSRYGAARPIPAPEDYRRGVRDTGQNGVIAKPSRDDSGRSQNRLSVPVREASMESKRWREREWSRPTSGDRSFVTERERAARRSPAIRTNPRPPARPRNNRWHSAD